ncbi:probable low molecular mass early light-inducible protein HV60, chloroplastic [Coccomyxa sp. Obi]|nr:probable low molecular mass early light-inducible protein HV60, chloroplastic [Coccomyxa sp. Obi]
MQELTAKLQGVGHQCHLPSRKPFLQPSRLSTARRKTFTRHITAAAADGESDSSKIVDVRKIGSIPFTQDNESFQQVMAFDGPAPERINGRIAMIAFVGAAAAEAASGKSILEQAAVAPVSIAIAVFLISLGSVFPKFAAGVPLATLTNAAGREGMPKELAFFNKTHEIWLGRVAMLGFLGTVAVEVVKGGALLGGGQ